MSTVPDHRIPLRLAGVLWGLTGVAVIGVALRRLSGAFLQPVPVSVASVWSTAVLLSCLLAWCLYRGSEWSHLRRSLSGIAEILSRRPATTWQQLSPEIACLVLPLTAVLSVTTSPHPGLLGLITGTVLLVGAVIWLVRNLSDRDVDQPVPEFVSPVAAAQTQPDFASAIFDVEPDDQANAAITAMETDTADNAGEQQSMLRRREDDCEVVEGWLRLEFADDQRELQCHIPFVPPLPSVPDVELEDLEGNDWELRLTACYPFGMRVAVRRRLQAPATGQIGYCATAATPMRRAG